MGDNGYALDMLSPVRHVATKMDEAAPAALSVEDMAATYVHPIPGDLARVKQHEKCANDTAATTWLLTAAVAALKTQISSDGNGNYTLAKPFDKLRYDGRKIHRAHAENAEDERRALRATYNDLAADRAFHVTVIGERGGIKQMRLRLHPLAHAIPKVDEKEFLKFVADVKRQGVRNPITTFGGQVLDGRHRLAVASALNVPLRITEFIGDEAAARDEVISQNVARRHLTTAQRALIVQELFLPQAEAAAKERQREAGGDKTGQSAQRNLALSAPGPSETAKAVEVAARQSNGLANVRTLQMMAPVRNAPKTQERIRSGEIKSTVKAREEALKETGSDEPAPVARPQNAYELLGRALGQIRRARDAVEDGRVGNVPTDMWNERLDLIIAGAEQLKR